MNHLLPYFLNDRYAVLYLFFQIRLYYKGFDIFFCFVICPHQQIVAEFARLTSVDLKGSLYAGLDQHLERFLELYQAKSNNVGLRKFLENLKFVILQPIFLIFHNWFEVMVFNNAHSLFRVGCFFYNH